MVLSFSIIYNYLHRLHDVSCIFLSGNFFSKPKIFESQEDAQLLQSNNSYCLFQTTIGHWQWKTGKWFGCCLCNSFSIFSWVVHCFFFRQPRLFILPKTGCPVNFLAVWDDWTTANLEHCKSHAQGKLCWHHYSHFVSLTYNFAHRRHHAVFTNNWRQKFKLKNLFNLAASPKLPGSLLALIMRQLLAIKNW